jgi:hypothetical protein
VEWKALHLDRLFPILPPTIVNLFTAVTESFPTQTLKHEPPINSDTLALLGAVAEKFCHKVCFHTLIQGKRGVPVAITKRFFTGGAADNCSMT